jgi:small subunit ribosomal protein S20
MKSMPKYDLTWMLTDCKVKGLTGALFPRPEAWILIQWSFRMANHPSALKAHRQNVKHRNNNRKNKQNLRTFLKKFNHKLQSGNAEEAQNSLNRMYALIDKSQKKKAISKNAAARQKSRLTKRLNAVLARAGQSS